MSTGDKSTSQLLQALQNKSDYYTRLTIIERKRLDDLNDALDHIAQQVEDFRARAKREAIDVMNLHILTPNPAYSRADGANIGREADLVSMSNNVFILSLIIFTGDPKNPGDSGS